MPNMITGWTNRPPTYNFTVFNTSGPDITLATDYYETYGAAYSNALGLSVGIDYVLTINLTKNGVDTYIKVKTNSQTDGNAPDGSIAWATLDAGANVFSFTATAGDVYLVLSKVSQYSEPDFSCTFLLDLAPPPLEPNHVRIFEMQGNLERLGDVDGTLAFPMQSIVGIAKIGRTIRGAALSMPRITMSGSLLGEGFGARTNGALSIGAITGMAYGGAYIDASTQPITLDASGTIDVFGVLNKKLGGISISATGFFELYGNLSKKIASIIIVASGHIPYYASLSKKIPPVGISSHGLTNIFGTMAKAIGAITLTGNVQVTGINIGTLVLPAIRLVALTLSEENYAYSMNMRNLGLAEYTNFHYNSLCLFEDKLIGANSSGIFLLEGSTDNYEQINWTIKTGQLFIGRDKLSYCRISGEVSGDVMVTVETAEGEEYEYILNTIAGTVDERRLKIGKGLRTKYVSLGISNIDQETISVDSIRVYGAKSKLR